MVSVHTDDRWCTVILIPYDNDRRNNNHGVLLRTLVLCRYDCSTWKWVIRARYREDVHRMVLEMKYSGKKQDTKWVRQVKWSMSLCMTGEDFRSLLSGFGWKEKIREEYCRGVSRVTVDHKRADPETLRVEIKVPREASGLLGTTGRGFS